MGLLSGFVVSWDRRGVLAALAIAVSVGYALVAGAAVTGLEDAQETLSSDLQNPGAVVTHPEGGFALDELPTEPDAALATVERGDHTFYLLRAGETPGDRPAPNETQALASSAVDHDSAQATLQRAGANVSIVEADPLPGAQWGWVQVSPSAFEKLEGPQRPTVHVAHYEQVTDEQREELEAQGFHAREAPAAASFYVEGAEGLVTSIAVTVGSSALVVALLATGFVNMELRARRKSLATLKLYAGPGLVRRVIAGRGLVLLAAGHVLALATVFALTHLISPRLALDVTLDPAFALGAASATFLGGAVGLAGPLRRADERVEASALSQREPPDWLPAWLRPSLASWRLLIPLVAAALILSASLGVVFGVVDLPGQLFGHDDQRVIADASGNPLRGNVDPFPGFHLGGVDGFEGASPEIFAPTVIQGEPVMARGVSWPQLSQLEPVEITDGRAPRQPGEAALGARLANRVDVQTGDRLTLPAAYTASTTQVTVVGTFEGGGMLADELLVPLDTARGMTKLDHDRVNMVRYDTLERRQRVSLPDGIEATGLTIEPSNPVPFEEVTVTVDLVNFASTTETRQLTLHADGRPVDDAFPRLGPRSTGTVEMTFTVPAGGVDEIQVNPTARPEEGEPAYEIDAPAVATTGRTLEVTVTDRQGDPAEGIQLRWGEIEATTNGRGRAELEPTEAANRTLHASGPEGRGARPLLVVDPAHQHDAHLVVREVDGPDRIEPGEPWEGVVEYVNLGGEAFNDSRPQIQVDDATHNLSRIRLLSGQSTRVSFTLSLAEGTHAVGSGEFEKQVTVAPERFRGGEDGQVPENATVEELLEMRREQASSASETGHSATQAFVADTFENLDAAITVIVIATILHAGLVTTVAVFREVDERGRSLGTLAAIGASKERVRARAIREYATVGAPAALAGTIGGLALAALAAHVGFLTGFGHALAPRFTPGFTLRVAAASLVTTLIAAVLAVASSSEASIESLMREGPARAQRPPLEALVGAEEPDAGPHTNPPAEPEPVAGSTGAEADPTEPEQAPVTFTRPNDEPKEGSS